MKQIIRILAVLLAALLAVAVLASCDLMAGPAGPVGPQGEQGEPGKDGINGKDGAQGVPGKDGKDGIDGKDGAQGVPGKDGKDGIDGKDGAQGVPGKDGKDGIDGKDGAQGVPGKDGKDGAPGEKGEAGRGILKTEIVDGWLYITYTDDPENPVKIGKISGAESEGTDGLEYYPLLDGTYAVSGGTTKFLAEISIPATHNGKAVTAIMDSAFQGFPNLISITIPDSVTSIGSSAFSGCSSLTGVYITDLAKWCGISFGDFYANPLYYAHQLYLNGTLITDLVIPDSVTSLGDRAFCNCSSMTSITIGNGVTSIGSGAFSSCSGVMSITIPDSVTSIGSSAFSHCNSLTSITIGNGVTSIGVDAFLKCYKLVEVYNKSALNITAGSRENGDVGYSAKAIYTKPYISKVSTDKNGYILYTDGGKISLLGYTGAETELTLPNGVTEINQYAINSERDFRKTQQKIPNKIENSLQMIA